MKKLSDYKGEEAVELWADLLNPFCSIVGDKEIGAMLRAKKPYLETAQEILKKYKKEATEILLIIDPTPIDGVNIFARLLELLTEIGTNPTVQSFFGSQAEAQRQGKSSGSATATTKETQDTSSNMYHL